MTSTQGSTNFDALEGVFWKFFRGELEVEAFEQWVYSDSSLEDALGEELYLDVISTDYSLKEDVSRITTRLKELIDRHSPRKCKCIELPDLAVVPMGEHEDIFLNFEEIKRRGPPFWWLSISKCNACGEAWLIASEERIHDNFCLSRLDRATYANILENNIWPVRFDSYEALLNMGIVAGETFCFIDPLGEATSLEDYIIDLAKERPGISVSELARLLNLKHSVACELSGRAMKTENVEIKLE